MAEETRKRQTPADIDIKYIKIAKPNESWNYNKVLQVLPSPEDSPKNIFENLTITESIFNSGITGILKIHDTNVVGDYFNMTGNEQIMISFNTPNKDNSEHILTFCVNDVRHIQDESALALDGPSVRSNMGWEISFISCEDYLLNWEDLDYMDNDFIGKIAFEGGDDKGFVDKLAEKYFNPNTTQFSKAQEPMDIENTSNSLWLKKNQNMYPWGKDVHPPILGKLMNNLAENAVCDEDTFGVNYLFYADLKGWHFKSIRKMIKDGSEEGVLVGELQDESKNEYVISDMEHDEPWLGANSILKHSEITEYDHLNAWNDGVYSSYYQLMKPYYDDPYFDYIDFTSQHTGTTAENWGDREIIDYSYHREQEQWGGPEKGGRVEKFKLIPDLWETDIEFKNNGEVKKKSRRKYDESGIYGYFDSPYNHPNEKPYDFIGSDALHAKTGKQNDILWQTMFDQTKLSGTILKTIQKEIKDPTRENYKSHVAMVNLKEKFNVYRHSICCDEQAIKNFVFLAWVDDARKIQDDARGGIYEYSWKEVEIWPVDFVEEIKGEEVPVDSRSPLKIVIPENGMTGGFHNEEDEKYSNPAYNINELLNTTDGDNVYVGPGVNAADEDHNDYPESYQMMPVGGFFEIGDDGISIDPCELQDEDDNGIMDGPWTARGHIVQMYRIPNYILGEINEDGEVVRGGIAPVESDPENIDPKIPTDIFFFDVPNAHDGLCSCLS
jgi:hypothetical protein